MTKFKNFLMSIAMVAITLLGTPLAVVHADDPHGDIRGSLQSFMTPNTDYFWNAATVDLTGVSRNDLFNFVTDVRNDVLWYPGVTGVTRDSGDGSTGTVYTENLNFGGIPLSGKVYIDAYLQDHYDVETSIGPVSSWGYLVFKNTNAGASLTIYGVVPASPFLNRELLKEFTFFAYESLANYYHTTGTITFTDGAFSTPASPDANGNFDVPFHISD